MLHSTLSKAYHKKRVEGFDDLVLDNMKLVVGLFILNTLPVYLYTF